MADGMRRWLQQKQEGPSKLKGNQAGKRGGGVFWTNVSIGGSRQPWGRTSFDYKPVRNLGGLLYYSHPRKPLHWSSITLCVFRVIAALLRPIVRFGVCTAALGAMNVMHEVT
jgi:hypothetical protein